MRAPRLYPQRVQHGFQQLGGPPLEDFAANGAIVFLALVGGLALLAAGVVLAAYCFRNFDSDLWEYLLWAPLILLAAGGYFAWRGWSLWGQELMVCPRGLLLRDGSDVRLCKWEDIRRIEEAGKQDYQIVRKKGDSWHLDSLHTPKIGKLEARLRQEAQARKIPWTKKKEAE